MKKKSDNEQCKYAMTRSEAGLCTDSSREIHCIMNFVIGSLLSFYFSF